MKELTMLINHLFIGSLPRLSKGKQKWKINCKGLVEKKENQVFHTELIVFSVYSPSLDACLLPPPLENTDSCVKLQGLFRERILY